MTKTTLSENLLDTHTVCGSCCTSKPVSAVYKGQRIFFCEEECKDEFLEDPEAFIKSDHMVIELKE